MRTTLLIDDDILRAAKELAAAERKTAGKVLSDLARQAMQYRAVSDGEIERSGVPVLPRRGRVVTLKGVQELMDEEGI